MFDLQFTRFVLSYKDTDNSNILMPEQCDLDIFLERHNGCKSCELFIVCESKDLFDPNKEEFLKRLYLSEFKRCARNSNGTFSIDDAVDAMRTELTTGGLSEELINEIANYVKNSYELSEIESQMSISAHGVSEEGEALLNHLKVGIGDGEVSISSISEQETSKKSFFTDNENRGIRKLGLESERLKYIQDLSVIREDTNSFIREEDFEESCSEDENPRPSRQRKQQGRHFQGRLSDCELTRTDVNEESGLYPPTIEKPAFASEIVNRPTPEQRPSVVSRIKGMFSGFYGRIKALKKKET